MRTRAYPPRRGPCPLGRAPCLARKARITLAIASRSGCCPSGRLLRQRTASVPPQWCRCGIWRRHSVPLRARSSDSANWSAAIVLGLVGLSVLAERCNEAPSPRSHDIAGLMPGPIRSRLSRAPEKADMSLGASCVAGYRGAGPGLADRALGESSDGHLRGGRRPSWLSIGVSRPGASVRGS